MVVVVGVWWVFAQGVQNQILVGDFLWGGVWVCVYEVCVRGVYGVYEVRVGGD